MITAKEARQLFETSNVKVKEFLTKEVEPKIIDASTNGKNSIYIHVGARPIRDHSPIVLPEVQNRAMQELIKLGYSVRVTNHGEFYIPRGLMSDDGDGPEYQNFGLEIRW